MKFNDIYQNGHAANDTQDLVADLSLLGEQLARRMELEDKLCTMLLD